MGMNVKAIERKIAYLGKEGGKDQYMYVMQPLIYNKLTPEKVIQQAALHCGVRRLYVPDRENRGRKNGGIPARAVL